MTDVDKMKTMLLNLEESFIEDYAYWKSIVEDINTKLATDVEIKGRFGYDEFCIKFKKELDAIMKKKGIKNIGEWLAKKNLAKDDTLKETMNKVFHKILLEKLVEES